MKIFYMILIISLLTSCRTFSKRPPMYNDFLAISKERYIFNENDCSNKSSKYCRILIEKGYEASILILSHEDSEFNHAVVLVVDSDGKRNFYDPTNRIWGFNVFKYEKDKYWSILMELGYPDASSYKDGKEFVEYVKEN